jgi:purine-nucleoside phosphorylase
MNKFTETLDFIRQTYQGKPSIGIILGTGLGGLVKEIEIEHEFSYATLPHFSISTVESHAGKLLVGKLAGKEVVVMQGRFHAYEGYDMQQITYPVRIMKLLGIESLIVSNISGGINPNYRKGDFMVLDDHINLQSGNPLTGKNLTEFGPRFPDMSRPYNPEYINLTLQIASEKGYKAHKGIYVAVNGPNLETRAEYRFLSIIGADVVGMSTVPEVLVAVHMNLKILAISLISDECDPDNLVPVSLPEMLEVAAVAEPKLTSLIVEVLNRME